MTSTDLHTGPATARLAPVACRHGGEAGRLGHDERGRGLGQDVQLVGVRSAGRARAGAFAWRFGDRHDVSDAQPPVARADLTVDAYLAAGQELP